MRKINVGKDYAFREQLKADAKKAKEQNEKKNDNNPTAGAETAEPTEGEPQANTQEVQREAEEKKKGKGKREKK